MNTKKKTKKKTLQRISKQYIKEKITTINNDNYISIGNKLGKTKEEIERFIEEKFFVSLSQSDIDSIRESFYRKGASVSDEKYGVKALANKYVILKKHVETIVEPRKEEEWILFFSYCLEMINKQDDEDNDGAYGGNKIRIPSKEIALEKLYSIFEDKKKNIDYEDYLWDKLKEIDYNRKEVYKIANEETLYVGDLIDFYNETLNNHIEEFLDNKIVDINTKIDNFKYTIPNNRQIEDYLGKKIRKINFDETVDKIYEGSFDLSMVDSFANESKLYVDQLQRILLYQCYYKRLQEYSEEKLKDKLSVLFDEIFTDNQKNFIKDDLDGFVEKLTHFAMIQGFPQNKMNINAGTMVANSGDAAQFLFIARAIMLGYNCSNVDVRSSRYDAVIDYEGKILKIQIKGISKDGICFKDRDRGGTGNDSKNVGNKGKYICSGECDIYVAVDKKAGICYLIPIKEAIDKFTNSEKAKYHKASEFSIYRENWDIIEIVANEK